jgi:hypothetical protein
MLGAYVCCKIRRLFDVENMKQGEVGNHLLNTIQVKLAIIFSTPSRIA